MKSTRILVKKRIELKERTIQIIEMLGRAKLAGELASKENAEELIARQSELIGIAIGLLQGLIVEEQKLEQIDGWINIR